VGLFGIVVVVVVLKNSFKKVFFMRFVLILMCLIKTAVEIMIEKKNSLLCLVNMLFI